MHKTLLKQQTSGSVPNNVSIETQNFPVSISVSRLLSHLHTQQDLISQRYYTNFTRFLNGCFVVTKLAALFCLRVCFYARSKNCEKRLLASSCPSVSLSACNNSSSTYRIFMKFDIWSSWKTCQESKGFIKFGQE
jgi:hypothetical protein